MNITILNGNPAASPFDGYLAQLGAPLCRPKATA